MLDNIRHHLEEYEKPKRKAISSRFPILVKPAVFVKRNIRNIQNRVSLKKLEQRKDYLECVVARHSSLLYRKLGDSDTALQKGKVTNLKIAVSKLNGLVIPPGEIFSLWYAMGKATKEKGYTEGMLLSNGKVSKGIGGGLCQISNFLFWILLHADVEVVERHHHSADIFPDNMRTIPFGSGATIFDNYLDLKMKNVSGHPLQIKLWLTDDCLKGQILSDFPSSKKFHLVEKNHCFVKKGEKYFRYNEIHRETYENGIKLKEEMIVVNFSPVIYPVSEEYLKGHNYDMVSM